MLSVDRISYNYGPAWVLKDVSFTLDKGDFLFLLGPSGAGKSTLLKLLYGGLPLSRGAATVCGFDLRRLSARSVPLLRRQVGVVFQDFKILQRRTVFENVALALEVRSMARHLIERRTRAVLRALGLEAKSYESCERLSGGEQQRVAIARSVVVNPQLILADEPTGNLDPALSRRLMDVFRQFNAYGTTIVMATHNHGVLEQVPEAKVLFLRQGRVEHANFHLNAEQGQPGFGVAADGGEGMA